MRMEDRDEMHPICFWRKGSGNVSAKCEIEFWGEGEYIHNPLQTMGRFQTELSTPNLSRGTRPVADFFGHMGNQGK